MAMTKCILYIYSTSCFLKFVLVEKHYSAMVTDQSQQLPLDDKDAGAKEVNIRSKEVGLELNTSHCTI